MAIKTVFSSAGSGLVSNDVEDTWANAHDATDGNGADYTTAPLGFNCRKLSTFVLLDRAFLVFDTSFLGDGATINSATFSFYITAIGADNLGDGRYYGIVQTSQASPSSLVVADFDQCGAVTSPTEGATRNLITATGYSDFTLNATGLGWINKTGNTFLGFRSALDMDNTEPTDGVTESNISVRFEEWSDPNQRPKLYIDYTPESKLKDPICSSGIIPFPR